MSPVALCDAAEWAKKVDWNAGGTAVRPAGKQPKAPISAKEAYAQYLRSHAEKSVLSNAPESTEQHSSVAHLKVPCAAHNQQSVCCNATHLLLWHTCAAA